MAVLYPDHDPFQWHDQHNYGRYNRSGALEKQHRCRELASLLAVPAPLHNSSSWNFPFYQQQSK
jgi:hypothetical protein